MGNNSENQNNGNNKEIFLILQKVQSIVEGKLFAFILPEHLLCALLDDPQFLEIAKFCKADVSRMKEIVAGVLNKQEKVQNISEIVPTQEFNKTLANCAVLAQMRSSVPKAEHIILALLKNGSDSVAAYALASNGITEEKVNQFIESKIVSAQAGFECKYAVNLTEKAKQGVFDKVIGREQEIERVIQILHKKRSSNVILVGNPGTGKTAVMEGLAQRIVSGNVPDSIKDASIWALDLAGMISGTRYRGEFEERLKTAVDGILKNPNIILFIDEIHNLMGAGGTSDGAMDASNIIKPYLTNGDFHCVGATTYEEYKKHILKDKAFARRFKKIDLTEPTLAETVEILKGLRPAYEEFHKVKFSDDVLDSIVELSDRFLIDQYFPDKAIEVMDEIGSRYRSGVKHGENASVADVEELICKIANIPSVTAKASEKDTLRDLAKNIKSNLFGQDEIVDQVVRHIKLAKAGLTNKNKPLGVFGMIGSSGSGKTEFAKQLASALGIGFLHLDMSEYSEQYSVSKLIGASPGYVGFEQAGALTEPLIRNPHCVVLLDEIEKADQSVYHLLLQVMDEGRLRDNNNREASFRNAIILMTSNVGCAEASSASDLIGFGGGSRKEDILDDALKQAFSPEFRNRFTAIFRFHDLDKDTLALVLEKEIRKLNQSLEEKKIVVELTTDAKEFLLEKALEENMGARPIERLVQSFVTEKLVDQILFEGIQDTTVRFDKLDGGLVFECCKSDPGKAF